MNPRRVNALMHKHFPPFDAVNRDWIIVLDDEKVLWERLQNLIESNIKSTEVLVRIHRKTGDCIPKEEVFDFLIEALGKSDIQITDRCFTGFVFVARNGVAAG